MVPETERPDGHPENAPQEHTPKAPEEQPEGSTAERPEALPGQPPAESSESAPAEQAEVARLEDPEQEPSPQEPLDDEDAALEKEFSALLDEHLPTSQQPRRGEIIHVPVVEVTADSVLVDVGGKSEARLPIEEFTKVGDQYQVRVGDEIPVLQTVGGKEGGSRLSHRRARQRLAHDAIRQAHDEGLPVRGVVTRVVKGGAMVDVGLDAFMPASQVDLFKVPDLKSFLGQEIEAEVLEFDDQRSRAVLSRRRLLFKRQESERADFLKTLEPGSTVTGTVKNVLDFGVFVELGKVDGFIPREEVSWDRGKSPTEALKVGDEVEVKILNVSPNSGKITLSRRRLRENPWDHIDERYPPGATVTGTVVAIEPYGAFIHIEEGITGMVHASDMSWASGNKKPEDFVRVGDEVTSQILDIDRQRKRLSLGFKQLQRDPWLDVKDRYPEGSQHKGTVSSTTSYGVFVKLDDYVEGMVHVSDLSWDRSVRSAKGFVEPGQEVEVVVLGLDDQKRRISLGMKQLTESPFDAYLRENPVGKTVTGKVTRFAPFGAFVELAPGLEGLIHISQIDVKRVELPEKALSQGEEVAVKIVDANRNQQKISLSRKEAVRQQEREVSRQYMKSQDTTSSGMSLGEALREAQKKQDSE